MLTPYMNSVPAVIAKASAIHNPIIYAITHPKYRYQTPPPPLRYWSNQSELSGPRDASTKRRQRV